MDQSEIHNHNKPSFIGHYNRLAKIYDLFLEPIVGHIRRDMRTWILEQHPNSVLDVCCGTGKQLTYFPPDFPIWGVDGSTAMLNQARKQTDGQCVQGDVADLPFPNHSFEMALSQFALHEKDRETIKSELKEIHRVLKPNGKLVVLDFAAIHTKGWSNRFFRWGIRQIEKRAGDEHFVNYQDWMKRGGLQNVLTEAGWAMEFEKRYFRENLAWIVFKRGEN